MASCFDPTALVVNCAAVSHSPGLRSRFKQRLEFPDWDADDVTEYLRRRGETKGMALSPATLAVVKGAIEEIRARPGWANARDAELVWSELSAARALRLAGAQASALEEAPEFTTEDARNAMASLDRQRPGRAPATRWLGDEGSDDDCGSGGGGQIDDAPLLPPMPPPPPLPHEVTLESDRCVEVEVAEERSEAMEEAADDEAEEDEEQGDDGGGGGDDDDVAAALQEACVALGYDESNPKRKQLVEILAGCDGGREFPKDILEYVCEKTGKAAELVTPELRKQVAAVISSVGIAIYQAEQEQYKLDAPFRAKIRAMALCPAGFDWHRTSTGWCCNGGAHQIQGDPEL